MVTPAATVPVPPQIPPAPAPQAPAPPAPGQIPPAVAPALIPPPAPAATETPQVTPPVEGVPVPPAPPASPAAVVTPPLVAGPEVLPVTTVVPPAPKADTGIQCPNPDCTEKSKWSVKKTMHKAEGHTERLKQCVNCNIYIITAECFIRQTTTV